MTSHDRRPRWVAVVLRRVAGGAAMAGATAVMAGATVAMLMAAPAHAAAGPDGLAAPEPPRQAFVEIDLFRAFTDCLAEAAHGDSMYPGIAPAEVNRCLADYGF